jgi:hypothetical protein
MKSVLLLSLVILFVSCNSSSPKDYKTLQKRIDGIETVLKTTYKPGFGELMGSIQTHHAKLWFAGLHKNWKLAGFEIHEINEALEAIKKYQGDRKETAFISMINPSIDSVSNAIEKEDITLFKKSYRHLTNDCNACHQKTEFEFNNLNLA